MGGQAGQAITGLLLNGETAAFEAGLRFLTAGAAAEARNQDAAAGGPQRCRPRRGPEWRSCLQSAPVRKGRQQCSLCRLDRDRRRAQRHRAGRFEHPRVRARQDRRPQLIRPSSASTGRRVRARTHRPRTIPIPHRPRTIPIPHRPRGIPTTRPPGIRGWTVFAIKHHPAPAAQISQPSMPRTPCNLRHSWLINSERNF